MKRDIIIAYENIVREYDNALLLKAELVARGYNVKIVYKYDMLFRMRPGAIVVVPNCYTPENYDSYRYYLNMNANIFISLQYEQVLSERIEKTEVHIPKGKAKNAFLFCWGQNCYRRLASKGINNEKIRICGAMQLDFLRKEFDDFYFAKSEIAKKYGLDLNKKWLLYISSFSYVDNPIIAKYTAKELNDDDFVNEFSALSVRSQKETLKWFEKLIEENKDIIVIYRKHPVEANSKEVSKLLTKHPDQFRDISELSVTQWIMVSDICATWFSTSAAEIYMAKRPLLILRPYPIKREYDVPFYFNAEYIDTYEKMIIKCKSGGEAPFPISKELLEDYYLLSEEPAYKNIADQITDILNDEVLYKNDTEKGFIFKRWLYFIKNRIVIKYFLKKLYQFLFLNMGFRIKNSNIRKKYVVDEWEKLAKNSADETNIYKYEKLKEIIKRYNETK